MSTGKDKLKRMKQGQQVAKAERQRLFLESYKHNMTNKSKACRAVGITLKTFYEWMKDEKFAEQLHEAKEDLKDFVENQLFLLVRGIPTIDKEGRLVGWKQRPNTAATIFVNKTINKDRGYVEKVETEDKTPAQPQLDLSKLSTDERRQLHLLISKARIEEEEGS